MVDEREYALRLFQKIAQAEIEEWSQGNPISWANETHTIALVAVYGELQHTGILPESYEAQALPIVNKQLERAAVRLAVVLNELLR